ncbi:MAG: LacI family DNA-binding transcriptional regulator [Aquimonas sp.]|nr:LacI family DNA-binding transcriptional regulator [Aquimonas sp.]
MAGVSQPTVSRALRDSPLVNAETRKRVKAIAQQLNYQVDKNASNLRTQHAGTLALLLFEDANCDESLINPFFHAMLASITRACGARGYDLLVSFQQMARDWHAEYEDAKKADGLILLGYGDYETYRQKLDQLVAQGTHFVRWGAVQADQPGVSIGSDNASGGEQATRHLIEQGRRRIAFLGDASPHYPEFEARHRGYARALKAAGLPCPKRLRVDALSSEADGIAATRTLLERGEPFDALFAASDLIALGAVQALSEQGLRVPEDVAVAGFDDIPMARLAQPTLTTVAQDTRGAGELLVATLIELIHGRPAASQALPTRLMVRRSCGAAAE